MEATTRAAGVEPTISTAPTHLPIDHDTASPRPMALVAILARSRRQLARDVRIQRLDVAPPREVELLLRPPLLRDAQARLASQPLGQPAVDVERPVPGLARHLLGGLDEARVHVVRGPAVVAELLLLLLRVAHRCGRLVGGEAVRLVL